MLAHRRPQFLPPGGEGLAYKVFNTGFDEVVSVDEPGVTEPGLGAAPVVTRSA